MNRYATLQRKALGLAFILAPLLLVLGSAAYVLGIGLTPFGTDSLPGVDCTPNRDCVRRQRLVGVRVDIQIPVDESVAHGHDVDHGMSGASSRKSSDALPAASPMISIRSQAGRRLTQRGPT